MKRASPICLRLCFSLGVSDSSDSVIDRGTFRAVHRSGRSGTEQEFVLGIFSSQNEEFSPNFQKGSQSAHFFFTQTVHLCIALEFC